LCASFPIRADQREYAGKLVETLDAYLRLAERHARAVALVKHPIRQLAAKVRPFIRVNARQFLATAKRRDLQRPPEQMGASDRRSSQNENGMQNVGGWADRVKLLLWDGTGLVLVGKRLEKSSFRWPTISDGVMRLTSSQLSALLEGLDWTRVRAVRVQAPQATL
jgi:hypothetical protein